MDVLQSKTEYLRKRLQERFFARHKSPAKPSILILGLGVQGGGVGAARFFARLGMRVTVTDIKTKKELSHSLAQLKNLPIRYVLGKHRLGDITSSDLIVKNPGIPEHSPYVQAARKRRIAVTNDGELFLLLAPRDKIIGVTGTKGKTTTTLLIKHLLGASAACVGIPGVSFFEYFFLKKDPRWIVAEFSSFDLEYTRISPRYAVIASLFADHLNRYKSFSDYAKAKMNLVRFQKMGDTSFIYSSAILRHYLPRTYARQYAVREKDISKELQDIASWRVARPSLALAIKVAQTFNLNTKSIATRLHTFKVPHGRLEIVQKKNARTYVNDTTSTNPGAAMYAVSALRKHFGKSVCMAIITGGDDKKFPLNEIGDYGHLLTRSQSDIFLIPGSMTEKLKKFLPKRTPEFKSLKSAVEEASRKKGIIALVPGAASFNMFQNEFDRARQFIIAIEKLS